MVVARVVDGQLAVVDRMKEMVQLGAGLDEKRHLSTDAEIRAGLEGNLCRCTGYQNIVRAVHDAASALRERAAEAPQMTAPEPRTAPEAAPEEVPA